MSIFWRQESRPSRQTRDSPQNTTLRTSGFSWSNMSRLVVRAQSEAITVMTHNHYCRREMLVSTSVRFQPSHHSHIPSLSTLLVMINIAQASSPLSSATVQFLMWAFMDLQTFTSTEAPPSTSPVSSLTLPSLQPTSSGISTTTSWLTTPQGNASRDMLFIICFISKLTYNWKPIWCVVNG